MRPTAAMLVVMLGLAMPASGQEAAPAPDGGPSEYLRDFLDRLGPALDGLRDRLGDLTHYEAPEVLPNGDILIRRKPTVPDPAPEPVPGPDGQIEL